MRKFPRHGLCKALHTMTEMRRLFSSASSRRLWAVCSSIALESSPLGGKGWFATEDIQAGTLVMEEMPLAVAPRSKELPASVVRAVHASPRLLDDLSLLSPSSVSHTRGSLAHASDICAVNATHALNVDDFAPFSEPILSFPRVNGSGRIQADPLSLPLRYIDKEGPLAEDELAVAMAVSRRSPGGVCLPIRRSLLNHSCVGNVATLYAFDKDDIGSSGFSCSVRTIIDVPKGTELCAEYLAGVSLLSGTTDRQRLLREQWGFVCRCPRCQKDDAQDVVPSRGWLSSAAVAMRAVQCGAQGTGEMLNWLILRQRQAAGGVPSYAEYSCLQALMRFYMRSTYEAFGGLTAGDEVSSRFDSMNPTDKKDVVRTLRRHSSCYSTEASGSNKTAPEISVLKQRTMASKRQYKDSEDSKVLDPQKHRNRLLPAQAALKALADQLPVLDAALHQNHPARVPALVAAALVSHCGHQVTIPSKVPCHSSYQNFLKEALRVHDIAYGGGLNHFLWRYGHKRSFELDEKQPINQSSEHKTALQELSEQTFRHR